MIDKKFKRKWLAALRSRKFKQAKGLLYDGKGYCCLGVACVVAGLTPDTCNRFGYKGDLADNVLPLALRKHLGMTKEEEEQIFSRNDGLELFDGDRIISFKPQKFGQIARWIEKHL